jgi:hypothetical protein
MLKPPDIPVKLRKVGILTGDTGCGSREVGH